MKTKTMTKSMKLVAMTTVLVGLAGCALVPRTLEGKPSASQLVKASEGGLVCTDDGMAHIAIPGGALPADTTITLEKTTVPAAASGFTVVGPAYEYGPSGLHFKTPATVTLHWDALPSGKTAADVSILAISDGSKIEELPGVIVDSTNKAVSAFTTHFTTFVPIIHGSGGALPSVTIGGPTLTFATVNQSGSSIVPIWLGPSGLVRTDAYGSGEQTLVIELHGGQKSAPLRIDAKLEDPGGPGTTWDGFFSRNFGGMINVSTDVNGDFAYTIDGTQLQLDALRMAPGYPSGRMRFTFWIDADPSHTISVALAFGVHPSVPR